MTNIQNIRVDTHQYEMTYGHGPRGRGSWAFATSNDPKQESIFWYNGLYSECKKEALKHFWLYNTIYVLT